MLKIFIVDDEEMVLKSLSRLLSRPDVQIVSFRSSQEALAHLSERPDLLICDYHLPLVDGLGVVRETKRHSPSTRTMLLSGAIEDEPVVHALANKMLDRFVIKPWLHDEMIATVDSLLRT